MNETKIATKRGVFTLACGVEVAIRAKPETVWRLLTDAEGFPRWNSTVSAIEGRIGEGGADGGQERVKKLARMQRYGRWGAAECRHE